MRLAAAPCTHLYEDATAGNRVAGDLWQKSPSVSAIRESKVESPTILFAAKGLTTYMSATAGRLSGNRSDLSTIRRSPEVTPGHVACCRNVRLMRPLVDRRIALLERRHRDELATLVYQLGGEPVSAPAMDEVACHDDFNVFMDGLASRQFSLAIFLSGAGVTILLAEADRRGRLRDALGALHQLSIACRGLKPQAALMRHGVKPQITTARPHTTRELLRALACTAVDGRGVLLVHHGERNVVVAESLRRRGARVSEVCPYAWELPEDLQPMTHVIRDAIAHRLDAILFTNRVQCRHLLHIAGDLNLAEGLALSLNQDVVVGAVGAVCARGLTEMGVVADVIPTAANMPALIKAMAAYFQINAEPA